MPTLSERAQIIKNLDYLLVILCALDLEDSDEFVEVLDFRPSIEMFRNLNEIERIPKTDAFRQVLLEYNDDSFNLFVFNRKGINSY